LHEVLESQVRLPSTKETRFFDIHYRRGLSWYQAYFSKNETDKPLGEVAPTYFASPEARERIAKLIPRARAVCTFRDPVERVRSHYRLKRAYAMVPWSFDEALVRDPELMESSRYATHLKAWQQVLGVDNVLVTLYDDLKDNPQAFIDQIADFIQVPRFALTPPQIHHVHATQTMTEPRSYYGTRSARAVADWFKAHRFDRVVTAIKRTPIRELFLAGGPRFSEISPQVVSELYQSFRPEVEELEAVLGRDLSNWKSREGRQTRHSKAAPARLGMVI